MIGTRVVGEIGTGIGAGKIVGRDGAADEFGNDIVVAFTDGRRAKVSQLWDTDADATVNADDVLVGTFEDDGSECVVVVAVE